MISCSCSVAYRTVAIFRFKPTQLSLDLETGTRSIDWAQLSRLLPEDGDRIQSVEGALQLLLMLLKFRKYKWNACRHPALFLKMLQSSSIWGMLSVRYMMASLSSRRLWGWPYALHVSFQIRYTDVRWLLWTDIKGNHSFVQSVMQFCPDLTFIWECMVEYMVDFYIDKCHRSHFHQI
jgi:hypothetical protein